MAKVNPAEKHDAASLSGSSFNLGGLTGKDGSSATGSLGTTSETHLITNGLCSFSPTSKKGKWIFMLQTIILSFTPIFILLFQNGMNFYSLMKVQEEIIHKNNLVQDAMGLSKFVLALQWERAAVSLSVFLDAMNKVTMMNSKERITELKGNKEDLNDQVILDFYNQATGRLLTALEKDLGDAQSSSNWKILMAFFNMIQCLESAGIGLVYGMRFYSVGMLDTKDMVSYLQKHSLMYEYHRQALEIVPPRIGRALHRLFTSEAYQIVNTSTVQILENVEIKRDFQMAKKYFGGSVMFMKSLNEVLDMLRDTVNRLALDNLHDSFVSLVWGISTLCVVLTICPLLGVMSKNAIKSIQIFALSVEKKTEDMKRQKRKQEKLIHKMLPKMIVERVLLGGEKVAESFDHATLYFSSVDGFVHVSRDCSAMQVVKFLNLLYNTMDKRMDKHDVYKVETISDQYMVVSGVPKKNGDKHASEICNMALDLKAACGSVVRPDIAPNTITIRAGIHIGKIVAGVVGSKMPRYCLFGDTINTTSRLQSSSEANKIHLSKTTWLLLSMQGGYVLEDRGTVEIKGKGVMETYWLIDSARKAK